MPGERSAAIFGHTRASTHHQGWEGSRDCARSYSYGSIGAGDHVGLYFSKNGVGLDFGV